MTISIPDPEHIVDDPYEDEFYDEFEEQLRAEMIRAGIIVDD